MGGVVVPLDGAARGEVVVLLGDFELADARGEGVEGLDEAFAKGALAEDDRAGVVCECAGDDLGCGCG